MPLKTLLKILGRLAPVVIANAPAVLAAMREITHAVKKPPEKPAA